MPDNSMGERIRMCREAMGFSQTWLADALGVDRTTVFRYETGMTRRIPMPIVEKIAELLNTTAAYLYYGDEQLRPLNAEDPGGDPALQAPPAAYRAILQPDEVMADMLEELCAGASFTVRAQTDALQPRIQPGDLLYMKGCRELQGSGIYLLWDGSGAWLSRLTVEGGAVAMQPGSGTEQTRLYTMELFEKTVRIIGYAYRLESVRP